MLPRLFAVALFAGPALALAVPTRAADPAEEPDEAGQEIPYEKLSDAGKNILKMATAKKLKEIGWGKELKGTPPRYEGYSVEGLLAAARMLRELPKAKDADPRAIEVTPVKDAPKGETPKPKGFDPLAASKLILERVRDIIETFEDPKQKEACAALVTAVEKIDNSKAVVGGPQVATRVIGPGQKHTFTFAVACGLPSALAVETDGTPILFRLVAVRNNNVHFNQVVAGGAYTWAPGGSPGQTRQFRVDVSNPRKVPVTYIIAVE